MALIDPARTESDISAANLALFEAEPAWARGLDQRDREAFWGLASAPREFAAKANFGQPSTQYSGVSIVLDGWISRHVLTPDGRRQIISIALPGDLLGVDCFYSGHVQHALAAITDCRIVEIAHTDLRELIRNHPDIGLAIGSAIALENSRLAEDAARLGRRTARERMAHFFCEIVARLAKISSPNWRGYFFPLTQEQLASILGLSVVHVNRTLQDLRADNLIDLRAQRIRIPDWDALARVAQFDRGYLDVEPRTLEARPTEREERMQPAMTIAGETPTRFAH